MVTVKQKGALWIPLGLREMGSSLGQFIFSGGNILKFTWLWNVHLKQGQTPLRQQYWWTGRLFDSDSFLDLCNYVSANSPFNIVFIEIEKAGTSCAPPPKKTTTIKRATSHREWSFLFFFSLSKSRDVCGAVALFCRADDETAAVWKFVSCVGSKLVLPI